MTHQTQLASLLRERPQEVRALLDQLAVSVKSEMPNGYNISDALRDALELWTTGLPEEAHTIGASLALFLLPMLGPEGEHPHVRWSQYGPGCDPAPSIPRRAFERSIRRGAVFLRAGAPADDGDAFALCMQAGLLTEKMELPGKPIVRIALWLFDRLDPREG